MEWSDSLTALRFLLCTTHSRKFAAPAVASAGPAQSSGVPSRTSSSTFGSPGVDGPIPTVGRIRMNPPVFLTSTIS